MPMEKVEFSFPDAKSNEAEAEKFEIVIEDKSDALEVKDSTRKEVTLNDDDFKIEVVDDTPPKDRNRKPSAAPEELTDEELENYSEKVKKRLQHFSKGYHDQRRAAEQAAREKAELEALAARLVAENKNLKGSFNKSQEAMLEHAKRQVERDLNEAKAKFKQAYDSGESDAVVAAQEAMTQAKLQADKVANIKLQPLQEDSFDVQTQQNTPTVDVRAQEWQKENSWFGQDDEMTSFALGLHQKLVKQGVKPTSDEYYEKINSRMREVFPSQFNDGGEPEETKPRRKANVVAPATRSTAPKKIVLSATQVSLAKRLGVPLEEYAKQVAIEMRKRNG